MESIISYINHFIISLFLLFAVAQISIKKTTMLLWNVLVFIGMLVVWKVGVDLYFISFLIGLVIIEYFIMMREFNYYPQFSTALKLMSMLIIAESLIIHNQTKPWLIIPLVVASGIFPLHSPLEYRRADSQFLLTIGYYIIIITAILANKLNIHDFITPDVLNHTAFVVLLPFMALVTTRNTSLLISQQMKVLYSLYFIDNFLLILPAIIASMTVSAIAQRERARFINHFFAFVVNILTILAIQNHSGAISHVFYLLIIFDFIIFLKFKKFNNLDLSFNTGDIIISIIAIMLIIFEHSLYISVNWKYLSYILISTTIFVMLFRRIIYKYTFDFSVLKILDVFESMLLSGIKKADIHFSMTESFALLRIFNLRSVSFAITLMLLLIAITLMAV